MVDLWRDICKPVIKTGFSHCIIESLSEFGLRVYTEVKNLGVWYHSEIYFERNKTMVRTLSCRKCERVWRRSERTDGVLRPFWPTLRAQDTQSHLGRSW
jgi:hypothetical protein